jgi:hypothetical protein
MGASFGEIFLTVGFLTLVRRGHFDRLGGEYYPSTFLNVLARDVRENCSCDKTFSGGFQISNFGSLGKI